MSVVNRLASVLRRLARMPLVRRVRRRAWAERVADAFYHGRLVEQTLRFTAREASRRGALATYRPAGGRLDVVIRHNTSDRYILNEIFRFGLYDVPATPAATLHALGRGPRVVDLGAHVGLFGVHFLAAYPDAEIIAVEADPANAEILDQCVARNGLQERWRVVRACAGVEPGVARFLAGRYAESQVSESGAGAVEVPKIDVLSLLEEADVVKIDIEGSEWPILADPRFRAIPAVLIGLEYHPQGCPGPDPRSVALAIFLDMDCAVQEIEVPHLLARSASREGAHRRRSSAGAWIA